MRKHTAWLLATLVAVALGGSGVGAERPDMPEKGLEWADEFVVNQTETAYVACSGVGTDSADDVLAWPNCACQGELDCPAQTTCFSREGTAPTPDGDNVCRCHTFYGFLLDDEGACEPGPMSSVFTLIFYVGILYIIVTSLSYSLVTVYQFIKIQALTFNPATLTLIFINCSLTFLVLLLIMYDNVVSGADTDYFQNDNVKGPLLGFFMVGAIAGAIQVLVMWIDVLGKSKQMTGNKKGGLRKLKMALNGFCVFMLFLSIALCGLGRPDLLAVFAFLMLFVLAVVFWVYGNRLAKMIQGDTSKPKSSAVVAIEHVAFRLPVIIGIAMTGVVIYVVLSKREGPAAFGFVALICLTFYPAVLIGNVLVCYVRFGARKKLVKAGYCLPNPLEVSSGMTTQTTTTTTTSEPTVNAGDVAAGNQISPTLKALNKFWAFGFTY